MPQDDLTWVPLATVFPAALDTESDPTRLADGYSPEAYGQGLLYPGWLYPAAIPTGTSAIKNTSPGSLTGYTLHFRRLWKINGANLVYNAPEYFDIYLRQALGSLGFNEDAEDIVTFFPFGDNAMFVAKSTGGYRIPNAASSSGGFQHGDIVPAMKVAAATSAIELDGTAYVANANGIMAWDGGNVVEVTARCRTRAVASYNADTLTRDEQKRWVIGTKFVYDASAKRVYDFATSGFRFTSRSLAQGDGSSFSVTSVMFVYEFTDDQPCEITFQAKRDGDWENALDRVLQPSGETRTQKIVGFERAPAARKFALRITSLGSNIRIRAIHVCVDGGFSPESWSQ